MTDPKYTFSAGDPTDDFDENVGDAIVRIVGQSSARQMLYFLRILAKDAKAESGYVSVSTRNGRWGRVEAKITERTEDCNVI